MSLVYRKSKYPTIPAELRTTELSENTDEKHHMFKTTYPES